MWFAPTQRVRATGHRQGGALATLELCAYWPLDDLLNTEASDDHPLGGPLLGARVRDIQARFPERTTIEGEAMTLTLDAIDFGRCSDQAFLRMFLTNKRVTQYELRISYAVDPAIATLVRARLDDLYTDAASKNTDAASSADDMPPPPPPAVVQYSRTPRVTLRDSSELKILSIEVKG
jgi:hypothetical protein